MPPPPGSSRRIASRGGTVCRPFGRMGRPERSATVPDAPARPPSRPRDAIRLELPGGGGIGDPRTRDPQRVLDDVRDGFISAQQARRDYGVVIDADGRLDSAGTERLRKADRILSRHPE